VAIASSASWDLIDLRCRNTANLEDSRDHGRVHKPTMSPTRATSFVYLLRLGTRVCLSVLVPKL
jgi:hypothetical protein